MITLVCTLALTHLTAQPPAEKPAKPAADAQARAVEKTVDRVLSSATTKTEAVLSWLQARAGDAKVKSEDAAAYLKKKTEEALAVPSMEFGVRVLARPSKDKDGQPAPARWVPLADIPVKLPASAVLLVHGLDEPGSVWDDLAPMAQEAGHTVVRFDYANDQSCEQSGEELAGALRSLKEAGVGSVAFVCHSMGGLIARDVLTRPDFYNGSGRGNERLPAVTRLITLGTPNHGSALAPLRYVGEAREQFMRWVESDSKDPRALLGFLKDGAGEAGHDLRPGSAYLKDLNGRTLPADVRVTMIVGTLAGPERDSLKELLRWKYVKRMLGDDQIAALDRHLEDAAAVVGDGIVTVESAKLAGVEDMVFVEATHRTMVRRPMGEKQVREVLGEEPKTASAIPVVLRRLAEGR
ncbi:MAG: alpha/beta fold hydrolase [Phycisphaerales bacterium]